MIALAVLWSALAAPVQAGGTRRALLVAVSDYGSAGTGWADLHSTRDVELLRQALELRGFSPEAITVITDAAATREGILGALEALGAAAQPGDHLLFHYSGHGQQVADDDGDEADGLDEALVPYGAPRTDEGGYRGERHLRDDDLGDALAALQDAVGPWGSVAVVLDSGHSGTAPRGHRPARGGAAPIGAPAKPPAERPEGSDFLAGERPTTRGGEAPPLVVLSAARADQVARETWGPEEQPMGALSLALTHALAGERPVSTWGGVFEQVRAEMARTVKGQAPQLEGAADAALFDGQILEVEPYFQVAGVSSSGRVRLAAGSLHGLTAGSLVELHRAGALEPAPETLVARGVLGDVKATKAYIDLHADPPPPDQDALRATRVFVVAYASDPSQLKVALQLDTDEAGWSEAIQGAPLMVRDDEHPDRVLRQVGDRLELVDAADLDTALVFGDAKLSADAHPALQRLEADARARLVQQVSLSGTRHLADVALVPARFDEEEGTCTPTDEGIATAGGEVELVVGNYYQLKVTNSGSQDSYLTLLQVDAEGKADQLLPVIGNTPDRLPAGRSVDLACFSAGPPYGVNQLKLLATAYPVDLGPVLGYARAATRGAGDDPLQKLLDSASEGTRGLTPVTTMEEGFSADIVYSVR